MNPAYLIIFLVVMNFFWSGAYSITKWGLHSIDELSLIFWRFAVTLFLLLLWIIFKRPSFKVSRPDSMRIVGGGLMLGFSHIMWVTGINLSQATDASLLFVFEPMFGIVLAAVVLKEKTGISTFVGLLLVIVGLPALSNFDLTTFTSGMGGQSLGNLMMVVSLLCEGLYSILMKPIVRRVPASVIMFGSLAVTVLVVSAAIAFAGHLTVPRGASAIITILYLSVVCTIVGYTMWLAIMKFVPVNVMLFTIFIQPIAGPVVAALTIGEKIDKRIIMAGIFLLSGTLVAVIGHFRRQRRAGVAIDDKAVSFVGNM